MFAFLSKVIGIIAGVFGVLKASGVAPNLDSVAIADITSIQAYEADYDNGQAIVIGTLSLDGKAGVIAAMADGGPAYQALFGSNAPAVGTTSSTT
jgi:hypothetical protein